MKISVVNNEKANLSESSIHAVESLVAATKKAGHEVEVVNLESLDQVDDWAAGLGDVVIFRWAEAVRNNKDRSALFAAVVKQGKIMLNSATLDLPKIRFKDVQQEIIMEKTSVPTIQTWRFESIKEWEQFNQDNSEEYPLIQKPRGGVMGKDVSLLESKEEAVDLENIKRYVFQTFIPNDGDYRVFLVGGKVVGMIKRIAPVGSVTNNIGQGGTGEDIVSDTVRQEITKVAEEVIKAIPLDIAGLDLVFNMKDKKYYFLEINISPQWRGFEQATGVDIGGAIISHAEELYNNK